MKNKLKTDLSAAGSFSSILFGALISMASLSLYAQDYSNLKITEISYHPKDVINGTDTTDGKDLEFIEFKNIGIEPIVLTGLVLDSAVYYEFPNDVQLAPGHFWVVASKPSKFLAFYGKEASGNFSGNLANSGDEILLTDASNNTVINFIYDDHSPWPEEPDGDGYTLVSVYTNPNGNPADESYWRASYEIYGSPFSDDILSGIDNNESLSGQIKIYPNPVCEYVNISIPGLENFSNISVSIYDISGSLIYKQDIKNSQPIKIKDAGLSDGLYFLQIEAENAVATKRLIISD